MLWKILKALTVLATFLFVGGLIYIMLKAGEALGG